MKFENQDFWNQPDVVQSQDKYINPTLYPYEQALLEKLPFEKNVQLKIQVLGCGTGREIPGILKNFPNSKIVASDIASKMIEKCVSNLMDWKLSNDKVKVVLSASEKLAEPSASSDIIVMFNSILTYVLPKENRNKVLSNAHRILKNEGFLIGVVHHRYGRLIKSLYFLLQMLYAWIPGITPGDRVGGFFGKKVKSHYYTINEVKLLLTQNGFKPILVTDLSRFYKAMGKKYNRWKGDNNIVFIGQKR